MSEDKRGKRGPLTREAVKKQAKVSQGNTPRRSDDHHPLHPDHIRTCFICFSEAERQEAREKREQRRSTPSTVTCSSQSTPAKTSTSRKSKCKTESKHRSGEDVGVLLKSPKESKKEAREKREQRRSTPFTVTCSSQSTPAKTSTSGKSKCKTESKHRSGKDVGVLLKSQKGSKKIDTSVESTGKEQKNKISGSKSIIPTKLDILYSTISLSPESDRSRSPEHFPIDSTDFVRTESASRHQCLIVAGESGLLQNKYFASKQMSTAAKAPPVPSIAPTAPSAGNSFNNIPLPGGQTNMPPPRHQTSTGPMARMKSIGMSSLDGLHHQISDKNIDEGTLDECFQIQPKWHYIKSNHEDTSAWLDTAASDSILLELLYFAHDQGQDRHKDGDPHIEQELKQIVESSEKMECFQSFCKTFIRDNRFRPAVKLVFSGSSSDQKNGRLFRLINADLQNLQRQERILAMVCAGTADHEVHTQAHRENTRKLIEDLISVVHPGDRATLSEVYKVLAESAAYDHKGAKPLLASLKLVSNPDIIVPYGGSLVRCGSSMEQRIRAKLPSLVIKMHFSERVPDRKWLDSAFVDDSGIGVCDDIVDDTGTGSVKGRGKDEKQTKITGSASKTSSKRKHEDTTPSKSKRQREDQYTRDSQPPDDHVINEIYGEHVAQLVCALTSSPQGYTKHSNHSVSPSDERDGSSNSTVLGLIISGDQIYLTKMAAMDDYLESLVETFRMGQLSFSCLANPLNLYKGTHLRALLMYLRYVCVNFPRTTSFFSD